MSNVAKARSIIHSTLTGSPNRTASTADLEAAVSLQFGGSREGASAYNNAIYQLRKSGQLENVARGVVRLAAPEAPAPEAPAPEAPAPVLSRAEEAPAPEAPAPEAPAPAKRRLKVANAPAATTVDVPSVDVPAWLHDEGIRALAIESTECFGAWAARSNECGKCPLAGWCRNAKAATLSLLASKLTTETPATPAPVKPSVATLDAAVGAANAPGASRTSPPDGLVGLSMRARHDGVCAVSGRPIKAGDSIKYLAGVGLYHADETPPATVK